MPPDAKIIQFPDRRPRPKVPGRGRGRYTAKGERMPVPDIVVMCHRCHDRPVSTRRYNCGYCSVCMDELKALHGTL